MFPRSTFNVLRTTAELQALVPQWLDLWLQNPTAKPFQRPEWLLPWWHHFGQPNLHVLEFRREGALTGLLPLYVYSDPVRQERQLLLLGAGTSDYLDGIFSPACSSADILEGLTALADEPAWDVAHLTQLPPDSPLYRALSAQDANAIRSYPGESCSRCPALSIAELPRKLRSDVLYHRNFATGRGKLRLQTADAASWPGYFDLLIQQHSDRWNQSGQPGVLADPQVLACHREALPLLFAANILRLYALTLDDVPIAVLYALIDPPTRQRRTVYFYLVGHSQEHAELKPGTLLTAMASESAVAKGAEVIDMLRGDELYKKFWHVETAPTFGFSFERHALPNVTADFHLPSGVSAPVM